MKLEEDVLLNMGVADGCLVSERTVVLKSEKFQGLSRRKSFIWPGHTC